VIGTLYAARLKAAGSDVTVLARGSRLADIERHGLVLHDLTTSERSTTHVAVTGQLLADDNYDLALVAVRRDQLSGILPDLASNRNIPSVLFMLNNPLGSSALIQSLGPHRVVLGFPGAGGTLDGNVVQYVTIAQQPTTIGEPDGKQTARLRTLLGILRASGLKVQIDHDMDAWLMAHAFFIASVSGAVYLAEGSCGRLSRDPTLLNLMLDGVSQGFSVVRALGHPVHPFALGILFTRLPRPFAASYWRRFLARPVAEFIFARHALHACAEMQMLAADCRSLLAKSGISAPAFNRLALAIDAYATANREKIPATPLSSSVNPSRTPQ
jgi:2-dehydropantoate 2-reductase